MCRLVNFKDGRKVAEIKYKHILNVAKQAEVCPNISRVMLFGSALEERCTDRSDIDVAVFGKLTKNKYLLSKEYRDFRKRVFEFDLNQDYDILYFEDGKVNSDMVMNDISQGIELFRRV